MRKITMHAMMRRHRDDEPVRIRHRGAWPGIATGIPYETYGYLALCGEITSMGTGHMITDAERWHGENPDLLCEECDHLVTLEILKDTERPTTRPHIVIDSFSVSSVSIVRKK